MRGRETTTRRSVDAVDYTTRRTFDALGQVADLTYPDGETVHYNATLLGDITGLASTTYSQTLLSNATRKPSSALATFTLGTGDVTAYDYDYRQRVQDIQTGTSLQHLQLTYDDASNVTRIDDTPAAETQQYWYDKLNRLTTMGVNGSVAGLYKYSPIGNLVFKYEGGAFLSLYYGTTTIPTQPHAATWALGYPRGYSMAYDKNGNLATQGANTYTYDSENRLIKRTLDTGGIESYVYDGNGALLKRTNSADGSATVYIGGIYEKKTVAAATTVTKYYKALGKTIAMRAVPSTGGAGTLTYILSDHLGSTTTTITNGLIAKESYYPFGATRSTTGTIPTDKLFTGQQQESGDSLGLYNYGARFYSTALGRFVSADTIADGLNRYLYARGNPLRYNDPTGHCVPNAGGGADCGVPTAPPAYSGTPTPGNTVEEINSCFSNLVACLTFSAVAQFGNAQWGLVLVMGLHDSYRGAAGGFRALLEAWFGSEHSGCAGRGAACADMALALVDAGASSSQLYATMGVKFIESDPGGHVVGGLASYLFHVGDQGAGELGDTLKYPGDTAIRAVYGFSLGADTVATFFAGHSEYERIPFYLDAAPAEAAELATHSKNYAGGSGFFDNDRDFEGFFGHHNHTAEDSAQINGALARCYDVLSVGGSCR